MRAQEKKIMGSGASTEHKSLIEGVHASTSERCTRAPPFQERVQMDQKCIVGGAAIIDARRELACNKGEQAAVVRQIEDEKNMTSEKRPSEAADFSEQSMHETQSCAVLCDIAMKFVNFKVLAHDLIWDEVKGFKHMHLDGEFWNRHIRKKMFQMDFMLQCIIGVCEQGEQAAK